jgi:hypothetical protein
VRPPGVRSDQPNLSRDAWLRESIAANVRVNRMGRVRRPDDDTAMCTSKMWESEPQKPGTAIPYSVETRRYSLRTAKQPFAIGCSASPARQRGPRNLVTGFVFYLQFATSD